MKAYGLFLPPDMAERQFKRLRFAEAIVNKLNEDPAAHA